ncbi:oligopeptide transporter, OPT family [Rhizorhabdus wittichii DC-6]|uniref:OPT family oligopeptide transporter n=1 Tax=Rhizorhabdus wittichii TaxID=160791 RepID=UPI0002DE5CD4|nr:oligopeptide transporter, OPT family [Rhizorhabdus wittichii]ARR53842.1 oligopeptide transporter, OPT family [Rhizorhabdus wittichii DC-6]
MAGGSGGTATGRELTVRGLLLGALITFVFTSANVYLGLRVGLTFATSIPAAVISMAVLRLVRGATIHENNIVQTVASAAGCIASIIFVLPGLIMIGWWQGFPFWQTFLLCASGGLMGVVLSVPLRRALVTGSDLPYPEGVAAAEVLKVGTQTREGAAEAQAGLRTILVGSIASMGFAVIGATKLVATEASTWFRLGASHAATGVSASLSFALLGAGHLVGLSVGLAMGLGLVIAFGVATPILSAIAAMPGPAEAAALAAFGGQVRFLGAGVIGAAAIWTLGKLARPLWHGMAGAIAASKARKASGEALPIEEQDMPVGWLGLIVALVALPIVALLWHFAEQGPLAAFALPLSLGFYAYVLLMGAFVAAVCGYMAGLIGSSNSPVSGLAILAVLGSALLLAVAVQPLAGSGAGPQLVAFALFVTGLVLACAVIANDNLQDLKTGQLIGATPWKQQVALIVGVLAGSAVIPPILDLLNAAYGFAPLPGTGLPVPSDPLPAPQATLIAGLARGILGEGLDWNMIFIGAALGLALVALDGLMGRKGWLRLPPLAVGIGIYLPMSATLPVVIGALIGWRYDRRRADPAAQRMGVLLASGFIVGESLFGVLLAGLIVATGSGAPLALVGAGHEGAAMAAGTLLVAALLVVLYRWTGRTAGRLQG